jgi:enterochelin esterase family protein
MHPKLKQLQENPDIHAIGQFLHSHQNGFPLTDRHGATFIYYGAAEAVNLQHWVYGLPSSQAFSRLGASDLWYLYLVLPPESRIEYKIEVVRNGHGEWITDPLNPLLAHDPFGANSVCQGYGYERPEWTLPDDDARPGQIDALDFYSDALAGERRVLFYLPARYRRRGRYPLLIVHDGEDYLQYAQLQTVLDNLIQRLEVAPLVVALTQSPDRLNEYAADQRHARFLSEELIARLNHRLALHDDPRARGLMGASFGGVASLSTAWYYPEVYGKLLLQSGSFAFTDIGPQRRGPVFDPVARFVNAFRDNPGRPVEHIFMSCGVYESLIYENRSMLPLLQEQGISVRYTEARDGHNWENWRDRLRDGLSWLFPGALWLFYE